MGIEVSILNLYIEVALELIQNGDVLQYFVVLMVDAIEDIPNG